MHLAVVAGRLGLLKGATGQAALGVIQQGGAGRAERRPRIAVMVAAIDAQHGGDGLLFSLDTPGAGLHGSHGIREPLGQGRGYPGSAFRPSPALPGVKPRGLRFRMGRMALPGENAAP